MPSTVDVRPGEGTAAADKQADQRSMPADRPTCRPAGRFLLAVRPMLRRALSAEDFPTTGGTVPPALGGQVHLLPIGRWPKEFHMLKLYVYMTGFIAQRLHGDDRGASAVEYGLLLALIAVAIVVTLTALGSKISGLFTTITGDL
jgi:pilus assembly protein Flp/PilA